MAEIAVALVTLGSFWAITRSDKKTENFTGSGPAAVVGPAGKRMPLQPTPNTYAQPANQTTDKFFNGNCATTAKGSTFVSLTGEEMRDSQFTHQNCVPFFGARMKGASVSGGANGSILDSMAGAGSQLNKKKEIAPLFAPQKDVHWANGMPNTTDFMRSRQMPSSRMANVKPWAEETVGPGLGRGDGEPDVGRGYNSGVQDRDAWLPKTVSELRVLTNPKETYSLSGHEGPAQSKIINPATAATQGIVNKNRPDTYYQLGASRWFTTTGAEKGETQRAEIVLQPQDRGKCADNYFGGGQADTHATYINSHVNDSSKTSLCAAPLGTPLQMPQVMATNTTGYENPCNNRASTENRTALGPLRAAVDAMVRPVVDVIRHTRKTNMVGSGRVLGNAQSSVGGVVTNNSQNKARTTIKEQTSGSLGLSHLNLQAQPGMTENMSCDLPRVQNRRSTTAYEIGIAGPATTAAHPAAALDGSRRPNTRRQTAEYFTGAQIGQSRSGGAPINVLLVDKGNYVTSTATDYQHMESGPYGDMHWPTLSGPSAPPTAANFTGMTKMRNHDSGSCEAGDRINPNMLTAFKANPYTHSLESF